MIAGSFSLGGLPLVRGWVAIGRPLVQYPTTFLLDTGSYNTLFHYPDVEYAGVDPQALEEAGVPATSMGIGGSAEYVVVPARVYLTDNDTGFPEAYDIDLHVAAASQAGSHIPSVLGRDILDQHRIVYDRRADHLQLDRH